MCTLVLMVWVIRQSAVPVSAHRVHSMGHAESGLAADDRRGAKGAKLVIRSAGLAGIGSS